MIGEFPIDDSTEAITGDRRPFSDIYEDFRMRNPDLPPLSDFLEKNKNDLGILEQVVDKEIAWCQEAVNVLDGQYGRGNYRVITAERGARDIRFILSTMGVDVTPFRGNGYFFKERKPNNWNNVQNYVEDLDLTADKIFEDDKEIVIIDTGFEGTVIKGLMEYILLSSSDAETNSDYADRVTEGLDPSTHVVVVGRECYGLRDELEQRGFDTSDFTYHNFRIHQLNDNGHIDKCMEGGVEGARAFHDLDITTPIERLERGEKVVFVTTEVDANNPDYNTLVDYLSAKGYSSEDHKCFHRKINERQVALAQRLHGYLVSGNSDSFYPELISPEHDFSRIAVTFESGPQFYHSVSRNRVKEDGKIDPKYTSKESQLFTLFYLSELVRSVTDSRET